MFGVSFLSPLFLLGALAAAVPILLHLFRRRTEVVIDFPAVRLLTRAPVEQSRRRRLREIVLLALRVAALALLALSFARPYLARALPPETSPITVVAVDTSLSLSAPGQMDRARAAARDAVRNAPAGHAVALLAFDDVASVVAPATADRGSVLAAIDTLPAGAGGTRYRTALRRATEIVGAREGRVVVVTDLQQAGWDANDEGGLPGGVEATVVTVDPPRANLAVTAAERRDRTVVATIQNFGDEPAHVAARLVTGDTTVAEAQIDVAAQSGAEATFTGEWPEAGGAHVEVDDAAGYAGDNRRYLVMAPPASVRVTVVGGGAAGAGSGFYAERALSVAGRGREFAVDLVDGRAFSGWTAQEVAERAALVVAGTRTLDRRGRALVRAYLDGGGHVGLALGPDVDPGTRADVTGADLGVVAEPARPAGGVTLVPSDARHPIFRPFLDQAGALGDVPVEQYRRLTDQPVRAVLARYSGGDAALVELAVGQGRLLVFTSDIDNQWSRFPLTAAFVPFAVETVRYLTQGRREPAAWVLPDVPPGVPAMPGVATVGDGPGRRLVAVNADPRESSPAAIGAEAFTTGIERTARAPRRDESQDARDVEDRQRWWQWGLVVMLLALAGEGLVGRRAT